MVKWLLSSYILAMSTHSVTEAKNRLPELIDRALKGEDVVITRHGHPVVELKPVRPPARPVSGGALDWLAARRVKLKDAKENAGTIVSKMRDEEWR
jgi:prevent-host-death family protein